MRHWNWDGMVEANRGRLIKLLAGVFAMLGTGTMMPRHLKRAVLARLVPMESALRRLIFTAARDLPIPAWREGGCPADIPTNTGSTRKPVFRLTDLPRNPDPAPRTAGARGPRISSLDDWTPRPGTPAPGDNDPMNTATLRRRLEAMQAALTDLPGQARRLTRWYARRDRMKAKGAFSRLYPIRSGRAPGNRDKGKRDVDALLTDCHDLALRARAMVEAERAIAQ